MKCIQNKQKIAVEFGIKEYWIWFQWYVVALFIGVMYLPLAVVSNPWKVLTKNHMFMTFWITLFVDYTLKQYFSVALSGGRNIPVIDGFFSLTLVHNPGAAFGLLKGWTWLFVMIALLTGVFILMYLAIYRQEDVLVSWALVLILSGAVGNLIDRIQYNHVIDYILLYYQDWSWPVFNFADIIINIGVGLILLDFVIEIRQNWLRSRNVSGVN